jgi:hypothetical protein
VTADLHGIGDYAIDIVRFRHTSQSLTQDMQGGDDRLCQGLAGPSGDGNAADGAERRERRRG